MERMLTEVSAKGIAIILDDLAVNVLLTVSTQLQNT